MLSKVSSSPELMSQWDFSKNDTAGINPQELLLGSNKKVSWVCLSGHKWDTRICHRSNGSGCPYCSGRLPVIGETDLWTTHPDISSQLVEPEDGYKVSFGSNKKLVWVCPLNHRWTAMVSDRTKGTGCPYCSGNTTLAGFNDLWSTNPDLSVNLLDQTDGYKFSSGSGVKLFWVCSSGHIWESTVASRVSGVGCPKCVNNVSLPETYLHSLIEGSIPQYKVPSSTLQPVDIFVPRYNLIIEYDGCWWHRGNESYDEYKTNTLLGYGFKVIRIRENQGNRLLGSLRIDSERFMQIPVNYSKEMKHINQELCGEIISWAKG